jgi:hypothetical protein
MERVDRLRRGFFSSQLSRFGWRISLTLFCLALAILLVALLAAKIARRNSATAKRKPALRRSQPRRKRKGADRSCSADATRSHKPRAAETRTAGSLPGPTTAWQICTERASRDCSGERCRRSRSCLEMADDKDNGGEQHGTEDGESRGVGSSSEELLE